MPTLHLVGEKGMWQWLLGNRWKYDVWILFRLTTTPLGNVAVWGFSQSFWSERQWRRPGWAIIHEMSRWESPAACRTVNERIIGSIQHTHKRLGVDCWLTVIFAHLILRKKLWKILKNLKFFHRSSKQMSHPPPHMHVHSSCKSF